MASDQEQLEKRISALMTVQHIAQELMTELDVERLLHKILDSAVEVLNASEGSLLIWVPTDELVFAVSKDPQLVGHCFAADKGLAGWVFTHCEAAIVGDVSQDKRFFQDVDQYSGFQTESLIAVPLMTPTEKIGVIQVLNKKSGEQFDEQDRDVLTALAAQAAIAYVNADLVRELEADKNRIIALQDQMNKKLARDLHDGPAQTLAGMMMNIEFILKLYEREPESVPKELRQLRKAAEKTLAQVRNTMFALRPLILETQGLKPALEAYVERLIDTEGMNIHLDIRNLDERLPARMESLCFAIIYETLGNVKKHAHAKNTWVTIERRPKDLVVAVRDDGKGFDVSETEQGYDSRGSLGLLNIKERAEMLGARYAFESAPGRGTLFYLIAPVSDEDTSHQRPEVAPSEPQTPYTTNGRRRRKTGPLLWPATNSNSS